MDPERPKDRKRIMTAVDHSRRALKTARSARREFLKRYSGSEWYENGADKDTPINQLAQFVDTVTHQIAGGEPQALVLARNPLQDAEASDQTDALNKVSRNIKLRRKLHALIRDAMFGMGIARVGMALDRMAVLPGFEDEGEVPIGKLHIDVISLDCWVHDMSADTLEEVEFCGDAYWVWEDEIEDFLPGVDRKKLIFEEKKFRDEHGDDMAAGISRGTETYDSADYGRKFWLWDLWLPREEVVMTVPVNGTGEVANVRQWRSRPGGPYLYLWFETVPDQVLPKPVVADLALVHDSLNSTFRKLIEQTAEAKTVLGYKPGHEDDAERIRDAKSRDVIAMKDPTAVQEHSFNGPDQSLLAMLLQTRDLASIIGGNTDAMGGLEAQADTLGQEQIIQGQVSRKVQAMQIDVAGFTVEMFEALRWYLWHEQYDPIRFMKQGPEGDNVPAVWSSLETQGQYDDYEMQIEPYSLVYRSPEQRLGTIISLWERFIAPALQMGTLGRVPNMDKMLEILARYSNLPELRSILDFADPADLPGAGGGESRQSPVTTRNYVRRGQPGMSRQGQSGEMMKMLMSTGQE